VTSRNPFLYRFGTTQGRTSQLVNFTPTDGDFAYVVGSDQAADFEMSIGDFIDLFQDLDLTGVNLVTFDLGWVQPLNLPQRRDIAAGATLKRSEVTVSAPAKLEAGIFEPYVLSDGQTLLISIDGGGAQTVTFNTADFVNIAQAAAEEVAAVIDDDLTPGTSSLNPNGTKVRIESETVGTSSTVEVTGGTATAAFDFPVGVKTGGDDLSAIVAPVANFTERDVGQTVTIAGTDNQIIAIVSPTTAVLRDQISTTPTGFTAILQGAVWEAQVWTRTSDLLLTHTFPLGTVYSSDDFKINVSKLTGLHEVKFRLEAVVAT
jgi:hypothetical protein